MVFSILILNSHILNFHDNSCLIYFQPNCRGNEVSIACHHLVEILDNFQTRVRFNVIYFNFPHPNISLVHHIRRYCIHFPPYIKILQKLQVTYNNLFTLQYKFVSYSSTLFNCRRKNNYCCTYRKEFHYQNENFDT